MKISKEEFMQELSHPQERKHPLIFIGMSSVGKTTWGKRLASTHNYAIIEIDELIGASEEYKNLLKQFQGDSMVEKMGNYFGKPWDLGYAEKEDQYLAVEASCMSKHFAQNTILDMTGSCIYHPLQMKKLAQIGLIIHLAPDTNHMEQMISQYLAEPKPVCWRGLFEKYDSEGNEHALKRCYPLLVKNRLALYERYADVTVPFAINRLGKIDQIMECIQSQLD